MYHRSQAVPGYVPDLEHPDGPQAFVLPPMQQRHETIFSLSLPVTFQGKYEEAEPLYRRSLAIREKVYGPDHPAVARGLNNWAALLETQVRKQTMLVEECFLRNSTCQSDRNPTSFGAVYHRSCEMCWDRATL